MGKFVEKKKENNMIVLGTDTGEKAEQSVVNPSRCVRCVNELICVFYVFIVYSEFIVFY